MRPRFSRSAPALSERVRTNNHVERTNRMFRFLEKVRYKWRRRTLVRFVVLKLDEVWSGRVGPPQGPHDQSTEISQTSRNATPRQTMITTSCVRIRWRLARSVANLDRNRPSPRGPGMGRLRPRPDALFAREGNRDRPGIRAMSQTPATSPPPRAPSLPGPSPRLGGNSSGSRATRSDCSTRATAGTATPSR